MHPFKAVSHQRQNKNENRQHNKRPNNRNSQQAKRTNSNHKPNNNSNINRAAKINYYVYGKGSAMEFFCDKTRKQGVHTISINAASKKDDTTDGYEWKEKTSIQLPRNEVLQIVAVLLGMQDGCEFRQNGTHSSKSYKVEFQESKVFFMVMEKGKPIRAVGLNPEDTYQVTAIFLKQLKENSPWMSVDEIIQLIEMTVVNMGQAPARDDDDEEFEQPADIEDDSISDDELLEKEPNFNF